jgi:membrane associated rhomboid family serine protease
MSAKRSYSLVTAAKISLTMVGVLFLMLFLQRMFDPALSRLGILPRTQSGLWGILFAPLLHANLSHLTANAIPFGVLMVLLLTNAEYRPVQTLVLIWVASGLGTWLIGRGEAIHLGASSVIFGLAAFLIAAGLRARSWKSVLVAVVVFVFYGGIFYGAIPQAGPVSWEGHLCGMIAGIWAALRLPR